MLYVDAKMAWLSLDIHQQTTVGFNLTATTKAQF